MKLILVDKSLIKLTSKFSTEVFIDYYYDLIGPKQAQYMADLFLSEKAITELIDDSAIFKLVMENDEPIGFIEYYKQDNRIFLSKFYVRKDQRNKGVGKLMLKDCIEYGHQNNADSIYLTVNKGNSNSIDIYNHIGFKQIDAVINDIGNNYVMDDYIMELDIKKDSNQESPLFV